MPATVHFNRAFAGAAKFLPLNAADNGLCLFLAIGVVGLGLALRHPRRPATTV